jgi:hypothetical protein
MYPRPTQGDENGFCSATPLHGSVALPFVIPTGAEGSAVQPTFTGNVFRQSGATCGSTPSISQICSRFCVDP